MSTAIYRDGKMVQLDRRASADQVVTSEDVQDPEILTRVINELRKENADLLRRFYPRTIYFKGVQFAAGFGPPGLRLTHNFNGAVLWEVVDWDNGAPPLALKGDDTDDNTLVLLTDATGIGTIKVWEEG